MDPMKAREMVGQLSELTTVEKLTGIEDKLTTLQSLTAVNGGIQNAGLIGRRVEADTRSLALTATEPSTLNYNLGGNAATVSVTIRDTQGNIVRTAELGKQGFGPRQYEWDGKDNDGARAPNGNYTFDITAKAANGQSIVASSRVSGLVTGVSYDNGAPEVIVGGKRIPLGDVTTIAQ
jgi:flagellar basal-body rod modification protein FlgD